MVRGWLFPGRALAAADTIAGVGERLFVEVKNSDGTARKIEALYVAGPKSGPTVVLYHGNGMNAYSLASDRFQYVQLFMRAGFTVYVPTMGGRRYEQSRGHSADNDFDTSELSMYADVDADMTYLQKLGVTQVGVVGLSLGGVKAFQLAKKYGAEHALRPHFPKVVALVADQTFTSTKELFANIAEKIAGGCLLKHALTAAEKAVPAGYVDRVNGNVCDGMNNLEKAKLLSGHVRMKAVRVCKDWLMGKGKTDARGNYASDFAFELAQAVHTENAAQHVISVGKESIFGHALPFTTEPDASKEIVTFFQDALTTH